jgi:hypothetical protein
MSVQLSGVPVFLGVVKSMSLYIFLALLVCVWVLGVGFADAKDRAADPQGFADFFLLSGFWALPVLVVAVALGVLYAGLSHPRLYSGPVDLLWEAGVGGLAWAFVAPAWALRAAFINHRFNDLAGLAWLWSRTRSILDFCWSVSLIAYVTLGLVAVGVGA